MKSFFLFILVLSAFVSCGEDGNGNNNFVGKTVLSVDGVEYDSTVCSFVKKDNKIVLSLKSIPSNNPEKYASIITNIIDSKIDHILIDYTSFMFINGFSAVVNNISISNDEISLEIEAAEDDDNLIKHIFKFNCYQEKTVNEFPKYYVNNDSENGNSKVSCAALKTNDGKYLISAASITKENNLLGFYGKSDDYPFEMIYHNSGHSGTGQMFYEFSETNNILKVRYSSGDTNPNTNVVECEIGKSVIK